MDGKEDVVADVVVGTRSGLLFCETRADTRSTGAGRE